MTATNFDTDVLRTSAGDLTITFIGHASLMMAFDGKTIHVDPFAEMADYAALPGADVLFLTHEHGDHMDKTALAHVRTEQTVTVMNEACAAELKGGIVMRNGEARDVEGIRVEAVPAYNLVHQRPGGGVFHPKGVGNGYVLGFGDTRVYVAGDTENTPEMKALKDIHIAFLPMNLPYTMTPEMVADAARGFRPKILYPYHFGETDTSKIVELLKDEPIEVRLRRMA
jgi:L-ascorbate metabolism protein UlaG (beta-lactamase superfamily)